MIEPREPKYQWGQPVRACIDILNDGSYPEAQVEELLVGSGMQGEIVQVGLHVETGLPVYMVEFSSGRVVGCLEDEIAPC